MKKKIVLLIMLVVATYAPALRDGFVWDDQALILRDPLIRSWRLVWEGFQHFLFTDAAASDFYRPLQRLSYTLDYAAFVFSPLGYHLVSILWHAAATVALFFFAEEFLALCKFDSTRRTLVAFLSALLWMVHPIQSAAVVYISGRADPLAAAFGFLALFLGLRTLRVNGGWKWALGLGAGVCFLASALSKEGGLLFLVLWLIIVISQRNRAELLRSVGVVVCVLVIYLSLRLPAEHISPPLSAHPTPLLVRPIITARAVAEYAGLLLFPARLHMERDVQTHPFGFSAASLAVASWRELQTLLGVLLIAMAGYAIWRARKRSAIFLSLVLAVASYLPLCGLVNLNATVAEHWLYVPSAFLFLAALSALDSLGMFAWRRNPPARIVISCLTIWLIFLSCRTFGRAFDWKDQRTFLTRTIADGGDSARMLINLGALELSEGRLAAAQNALQQALVKEPENRLAQLNLGAVALKQRDFPRARAILERITDPPDIRARAQESIAVLENRESGQINLVRLRLAARLGPMNWTIEKRYIKTFADLGYPERAIAELKSCLASAPYRAESWEMISELLRKIGRPNEAGVALAEAEANDVHLHEHPNTL